jgi:hypothetical protein
MSVSEVEKPALKGRTVLPDLSALPKRVPRKAAAGLVRDHFFQISPRTLERWPLRWRLVNGKAHCETADLFAEAERRLNSAPAVMGGLQPKAAT